MPARSSFLTRCPTATSHLLTPMSSSATTSTLDGRSCTTTTSAISASDRHDQVEVGHRQRVVRGPPSLVGPTLRPYRTLGGGFRGKEVGDAGASSFERLIGPDRVSGRLYTDSAIFERELERIHHRGWAFVGHESEVATPGEFVTRRLGRQPVLLTRDDSGAVRLWSNRCPVGLGNSIAVVQAAFLYSLTSPSHRAVRSAVAVAGGVGGVSEVGVGGRCWSARCGRCWL